MAGKRLIYLRFAYGVGLEVGDQQQIPSTSMNHADASSISNSPHVGDVPVVVILVCLANKCSQVYDGRLYLLLCIVQTCFSRVVIVCKSVVDLSTTLTAHTTSHDVQACHRTINILKVKQQHLLKKKCNSMPFEISMAFGKGVNNLRTLATTSELDKTHEDKEK
nr:hypothetical protein [Tanacetum cinerariifolium]